VTKKKSFMILTSERGVFSQLLPQDPKSERQTLEKKEEKKEEKKKETEVEASKPKSTGFYEQVVNLNKLFLMSEWVNFFFFLSLSNQWEGSNRKQSARWQHVSRLKACAFCIG
jgi:hypothetical protein